MATMNDRYGDGSNHEVCDTCGMCIICGDCICSYLADGMTFQEAISEKYFKNEKDK